MWFSYEVVIYLNVQNMLYWFIFTSQEVIQNINNVNAKAPYVSFKRYLAYWTLFEINKLNIYSKNLFHARNHIIQPTWELLNNSLSVV